MNEGNNLFYVCSLIEYIGRERKLRRADVAAGLGESVIRRIFKYADTFHCEQIAKVADDFITMCNLPTGSFDNVASCRYDVPGYWDIGAVYARLIEDVSDGTDLVSKLMEVYSSKVDGSLFVVDERCIVAIQFRSVLPIPSVHSRVLQGRNHIGRLT